ncbi:MULTISPECIES: ABC transporter ATP-binding protein [unclassified Rhizobium]|uniref:ABC transporter ATP-binding protein n=1 Tax=unclassified Rhizobium TaxID=2613769 RepID=UPI00071318B2|nr:MULTISPECIES: ABC transporter ATP-binding protein [unclassified Rhizobium]KQS83779.1 nitrate/sulfonate/bicarbonate ABC transporter ATP-binding protein [Rhizobium sp. Leaf386]KQT04916.1 nitrate/sulfonate/bicarbonate ABC transporter ATP-binding protein [Rhizobium sp. Leaf391]KQU08719.1 nitrate/sulfonate/bicarbonate ABC transporter ATP-binding protein [Rhizobium sp. Leaf453]
MTILELSDVSKSYGQGKSRNDVLTNVNLKVKEGEFIAIVGFSGAGKTTLISLLAGLIKPDSGVVLFNDREITGPGPERGVVFQSYSLMPWLTVDQNVSLAVDSVFKSKTKTERRDIVSRYVAMVGLAHARDRKPAELSGGMRQRVAVARALAMQPQVLLMDEPLSALDALTRSKLQDEFAAISEQEKKTIILVTNDVDEAILLADRIIPLTPGPNATLGPSFDVTLSRPRDRAEMNSDPDFIRLRAEVTAYLMDVGADRNTSVGRIIELPNVIPITQKPMKDKLPAAYERAARTVVERRFVEFSEVRKTYATPKGPLTVVDGFDLKINKGEFISVIGHSGCGKSTVLSMAAGLNSISGGGIILDGKEISGAGPDRAVVFQSPSLMPWLTARENVALGVDRVYPTASPAERKDIVEYYLEKVGLGDSMHRVAADLSNGMKQRVGIARAFALSPKLLLLDEPFGMLDSLTRWELQEVLMDVWARTKVTAICVTHDVDEAILLADRVVMMSNGPNARIGNIMDVNLPRPRSRKALLAHRDYYAYREELIDFLEAYEGGANPSPEHLETIRQKRAARLDETGSALPRTAAE